MMDLQQAFDAGFEAVKSYVDDALEAFASRLAAIEALDRSAQVGADGAPGRDGAPGERGADGLAGAPGTPGRGITKLLINADGHLMVTFSDGAVDDVGRVVGRDGADGEPGANGVDGVRGADGLAGRDGADGKDGRDGADGKDGVPGRDGADGQDGKSIDPGEVAGMVKAEVEKAGIGELVQKAVDAIPRPRDGVDGKDGAQGERGADGVPGTNGKDGAPGRDGAPGKDGEKGADGLPGRDGIDGAAGRDGKDGLDGAHGKDGLDGAPGKDGRDGADGLLPLAKAWDGAVSYRGEVRTHNGALWQARSDTGREPGHDDWICLAAAGRPGKDADQIDVRGTYDPDGSYKRLSIVALNGGAWIARTDDPGPCPGDGWQVIAMRGKPGQPGEARKGDKGDSIKGDPGPRVETMSVDGEGMLTLINADGSTVQCDLYSLLRKIGG